MPQEITGIVERLELLEEQFGIELSGIYASFTELDDGRMIITINFDIASRNSSKADRNICLRMNAYNAAGQLLKTSGKYFWADKFIGFDSHSFVEFMDQKPNRIRLFPLAM